MTALACYRVRDRVAGTEVRSFDDIMDLEAWGDRIVGQYEVSDAPLPARLYVVSGAAHPPEWLGFLRDGFGPEVTVRYGPASGALLIVRVRHRRRDVHLAFAFGIGRYLLRDNAYVRNFGLRVALNAIFEGDVGVDAFDAHRLRAVTARRVSANTLRMQGQASRRATMEDFEVDLTRDLLHGVTGEPANREQWGTRINGAHALHLSLPLRFDDLPVVCSRLLTAHEGSDYRARFAWIDDVSRVDDPDKIAELERTVVERLKARQPGELDLAVPELVEWHRIHRFRLPYERRARVDRPELRLTDLLTVLHQRGELATLDARVLHSQRIDALDGEGGRAYSWNAWRCLTGELHQGGCTYILDDGDFFEINPDYLAELDRFITINVPESSLELPASNPGWAEGQYNAHAAANAGLVLLDRRTVRVGRSTTPIEVCDLLSADRRLVHVKRKLGSSLLSHLFAQGLVSADLLLTSPQFRNRASQQIGAAISEHPAHLDPALFALFGEEPIDPAGFEIVYAIVADWGTASLADRLPFFSKVNLRRCAEDLQRRRFRVTHRRISNRPPAGDSPSSSIAARN